MKQVNLGFYRMVLFLLLGLFTSVIAYSQQISVKGIVKDQIGEPVIGANVLVRGTTNGVITNVNGEFILSASKSDVLVVSFVGYTTQEIPVSGEANDNCVERRHRIAGRGSCFGIWCQYT